MVEQSDEGGDCTDQPGFCRSVSDGRTRAMVCHLPGEMPPTPEQVFPDLVCQAPATTNARSSYEHNGSSSEHKAASSAHSVASSEHKAASSEGGVVDDAGRNDQISGDRDERGRWVTPLINGPILDRLDTLPTDFYEQIHSLAAEARLRLRLERTQMEAVILTLCREQFVTLPVLAELTGRNSDGLRQRYLAPMIRAGRLVMAFPTKPTHERQAYRAAGQPPSSPSQR